MRYLFFVSLIFILFGSVQESRSQNQYVPVYEGFESFEPLLHKSNDTTYVINFWATWCKPCVKEMPYFQQAQKKFRDNGVKVILVSMDFGRNAQKRVQSFVEKHDINLHVVILNDPKSNEWINKVSEEWSGVIPSTLIYNKQQRNFYEKGFTKDDLFAAIRENLNQP